MLRFIVKRLFYVILIMIGVSIIVFLLLYLTPGDPVQLLMGDTATPEMLEAKRVEMGFDQPLIIQFWRYFSGLLQGDFGTSIFFRRPCLELIIPALLNTLKLTAAVIVLTLIIAVPMGIIAGVKRGSGIDLFSMAFAMLGQSMAPLWFGILMILVFAVRLGWFPAYGDGSFKHIILPALTCAGPTAAVTTRMIRSGMIETLDEDFILAARAKGELNSRVVYKYALKNVLLPVITVVGMQIGQLFGGSVVTESLFSWNGIGRLMIMSINKRDYPLVQGGLLVTSLLFVLVTVAVDILYMFVDPRLRITSSLRANKGKEQMRVLTGGTQAHVVQEEPENEGEGND